MKLNDIIRFLTQEDIAKLFNEIYFRVCQTNLLKDKCGLHHEAGDLIVSQLKHGIHPQLLQFLDDCKLKDSKDASVVIIDILKDAELILINGHDMNLAGVSDESPDALFIGVCYEEYNPDEEMGHYPKLSSIILIGEGSSNVTNDTHNQILIHELIHFLLEYLDKVIGYSDIIEQIKKDKIMEEFLCDMLGFFYLGQHTLKDMIEKYTEYASKFIRSDVISDRKKLISNLKELIS